MLGPRFYEAQERMYLAVSLGPASGQQSIHRASEGRFTGVGDTVTGGMRSCSFPAGLMKLPQVITTLAV